LIAARLLYEELNHADDILRDADQDVDFRIFTLTTRPPDSNIVIFGVKRKGVNSIKKYNELNDSIYNAFAIQSERGEREYSYSQPFFLSKTTFKERYYSKRCLREFLERCEFYPTDAYVDEGLRVLRATVMNPYIYAYRSRKKEPLDLVREFLREIHHVAKDLKI